MRCDDFEARLNQVLDERRAISSASDLTDHLRDCAGCRTLARSYEAVFIGLRQAAIPAEPEWVTDRVLAQLGPRTGRPPWRRVAAVFALAAALLLAVGLGWIINPNRPAATNRSAANALSRRAGTPDVAVQHSPRLDRTGKQREEIPPPVAGLPGEPSADELLGLIPAADWAQDVADGLEPVTRPTVGAITGFLRLWGVGDEGRRS